MWTLVAADMMDEMGGCFPSSRRKKRSVEPPMNARKIFVDDNDYVSLVAQIPGASGVLAPVAVGIGPCPTDSK